MGGQKMKLTNLLEDITEILKICKNEKIDPNIWVESKGKIYQLDKIRLESGFNINDEQVSNLTFITTKEGQ